MRQSTKAKRTRPADVGGSSTGTGPVDTELLEFRAQFEERSPLDEAIYQGARKMLQAAIDAEVEDFVAGQADRRDNQGRRLVVRNGRLPAREILTGAGRIDVKQPRVRDNSPEPDERVRFSSKILPPYLRRSRSIDELIPWLYLKGR